MKTDLEIQKHVMEEFKWEPILNATEIGVSVTKGVVTLSGTVDSYLKKSVAEKAAKRVAGVKAIAEDIEVKYGSSFIKNDTEIAQEIVNALKWHSAIREEKLKVKVENGVVTIDGEVDWAFERNFIITQIEGLLGVKHIINHIAIRTITPLKDIKEKITAAFQRSATIDSDKIRLDISGNKVTLKGTVRSWAEKHDAESAVWSAHGITEVDNQLEIESEVFELD